MKYKAIKRFSGNVNGNVFNCALGDVVELNELEASVFMRGENVVLVDVTEDKPEPKKRGRKKKAE